MLNDKVRLEILSNRFQAIVDEMAQVISRTAHTVFVKETQDYGSVLVSRQEVFAAPRRYGVLMMIGMPMEGALAYIGEDVCEGDIFISNDPEATRGMCTHLSDVYLWKPVFVDGRLLCWAWSFIHGVDGTMVILNFLKNIPTEIFENEMPEILIHHYGLREDSGGAGEHRGGTGIEIEFETSVPYTSITSRCMERYLFGPPGRLGDTRALPVTPCSIPARKTSVISARSICWSSTPVNACVSAPRGAGGLAIRSNARRNRSPKTWPMVLSNRAARPVTTALSSMAPVSSTRPPPRNDAGPSGPNAGGTTLLFTDSTRPARRTWRSGRASWKTR